MALGVLEHFSAEGRRARARWRRLGVLEHSRPSDAACTMEALGALEHFFGRVTAHARTMAALGVLEHFSAE